MAIAFSPSTRRRYNHNPRGSATAHVTLPSNNPFERRITVVNDSRSMIPGMGDLGAEAAPKPGIDWASIATGVSNAAIQVGQQAATNAVNRILPPPPSTVLQAPQTQYLQPSYPTYAPAPKSGISKWVIGGGIAVLGIGVLFLVTRKKR
jgi:hypothetical protein